MEEKNEISTIEYDRYVMSGGSVCSTTDFKKTTVPITFQMIHGVRAEVLWDSGASVTLISAALLKILIDKGYPIRQVKVKDTPTFTCANESTVSPNGFATFNMDIDSTHTLTIGCWVLAKMPHDIIIGSDTMRRTKA